MFQELYILSRVLLLKLARLQRGAALLRSLTCHLFRRLCVLLLLMVLRPAVTASLEHATGRWLLAQAARPAKMPPTGSLIQ